MEAFKMPKDIKKDQDAPNSEKSTRFLSKHGLEQEPVLKNVVENASKYSESGDKQIEKVKNRKTILDYEYKGQRFEIHRKNSLIYINHPKWSLVGMGETLLEAEIDMLNDAKIIAEDYINEAEHKLSPEAQEFKKYLLNIV